MSNLLWLTLVAAVCAICPFTARTYFTLWIEEQISLDVAEDLDVFTAC